MDNNKSDNFDANTHPDPLMEAEKTTREYGEDAGNEAWANWHPVTVKTEGLKAHTGSKLTDKQLRESNAPHSQPVTAEDYRRKVGRATVRFGQMDTQPKGLDYSGLTRADYDAAVQQGLDMTDQKDIDYVKTIKRARTDG